MSTTDSSHGLDRLFTAHLPEFIQVLSAGLSPIKQHKQVMVDRADHEHPASRANQRSPTASGVSSGIQRSFSAVQLHDPGLSMPGQQLPQQHWSAHKRTASTDAMASCWTDGCSSGSPGGDADCSPCSSTGSASPEVNSAGAEGSSILLRTGWRAGGSAPDVPAAAPAAMAAGQVPLLQQKRLPPCPVLWRPAPSLVRGVPVAEGVEDPKGGPAQFNPPATSTADTSQHQQYLGPCNAAAAPAVADEQQQQQQPAASEPSSPDLRSSRSSYVRSSSIANLMQALHGLLGTSGGSSTGVKLQVQAPAESQALDVREYINCYSPDAITRGHSRTSSRAQEVQQSSSNRSSPSASPRASGSFPDLRLFWSNYSQAGSKMPSRHPSSAAVLQQQVMQQPHVEQSELSGAQAEQQQQQQQTQQNLPQTRQVAVANPAAVLPAADVPADAAALSSSADAQAGVRKVLPQSPSPSKRSILLHGPSRLSLRTSMQDAAAAATGGAQQALTASAQHSAAAVGLPQEQPAGPLQQHVGRLLRRSETEAVPAETVPAATGQQHVPELPPQDQQQQVQRQLFAPQEAAHSIAQAPHQQLEQQKQATQVDRSPSQPAPAVSPSKKQSMLWSLMHRKGSSSQLAPAAPVAAADSGASTLVDKCPGAVVSAVYPVGHAQALSITTAASSSAGGKTHDLTSAGQRLQAPPQLGASMTKGTVVASSAIEIPPAAGVATCGSAADVVASSMERIASCLEDFLCDRSPSVSPTRDRPVTVRGQHTSRNLTAAAAETGMAGVHGSPSHAVVRDQGQGCNSSSAGDAAQHVTPKKVAAGGRAPAGTAPVWSPAAAAAKARMMAALSPSKLQSEVIQPAAGRDTGPGAQLPQGDQDSRKEGSGAAAGWLHPGDLRPAAAAGAHAAGRLKQSGHQLSTVPAVQSQQQAASLSQLPRGLRPPPGLGLNSQHQQQQQQQQPQQPVAQSRHAHVAQQQTGAVGTAPGGGDELASLFALACRAVGVDLLEDSQQAAAPAVTAAALTAAMAAAATAYQQQAQQQPHVHQVAPPHAWASSAAAVSSQNMQQRRHRVGARLWRAQGGVALGAEQPPAMATCGSSSAGIDASWHASMPAAAVASGDAHSALQHDMQHPHTALEQQHWSGQVGGGGKLWQQRQQPVHGQQATAQLSSASIRTLQPERASQLRLLRPGQPDLQSAEDHLYGSWPTHSSGLGAAHQQQRQQQQQQQQWSRPWQAAGGSSSVQGASRGPKLVRLPVQQQPAAPLRPHVLVCSCSATSGEPTAPWLHPAESNIKGVEGQPAAVHAVDVDAKRPQQQLLPWQSMGRASHAVPAVSNQSTVQEGAAGRALGGIGLGAGAAAARLLQGLADLDSGADVPSKHGGSHPKQPDRPLAGMMEAPAGWQESLADSTADGCRVRLQRHPFGPHLQHPVDVVDAVNASAAAAEGAVQDRHQAERPVHPVVIGTQLAGQQQQQRAPWQQEGTAPAVQQQPLDQPQSTVAEAAQLQAQQQQWQVTFPAPHSPIKSPRKHPVGRRWALLQKLKAVNRGKATAAAPRPGQADAAAQLVAQLQQLMQGPAAAMQGPAEVSSRRDSWKPDLNAAAAMALHAGPQQQAVDTAVAQQLQPQGQDVQGPGLPEQVSIGADGPKPLSAQASLQSAAAQTSKVLGADPLAAMADAAVQAASATAEAGTESEQQSQGQGERQQGALELAQLILRAFDQAGGVILPEGDEHAAGTMPVSGAGSDAGAGSVPQQLQQGSSWGLLANPFAGPAAPQFQQVVDLQPDAMLPDGQVQKPYPEQSRHAEQEADQLEDQPSGLQLKLQGYGVVYQEAQEQPSQQWLSSSGPAQHGCCFAACPRHISSPDLGESRKPQQQQRVSRRTGSTAASSRRTTAEAKSQQQQQQQQRPSSSKALGKTPAGAPSLARNSRSSSASARQLTANLGKSSSSSRRLSQPRAGVTGGQREPAQQQQQQQQRWSSTGQPQSGAGQAAGCKAPVSPNTWACEQTKQLDELWQQWHKQQIKAMAASGTQPQQQADAQQQGAPALQQQQQEQQRKLEQQLLDERERQELEAAYARAAAARASAKKAAQHAAASRSQRLRAELVDLGRMLAEVDTLAAQMEVESTQAAAAVEQFEADLYKSRASLRTSAAGSVGVCAV